jgi:SAM-dependent methyltransferase
MNSITGQIAPPEMASAYGAALDQLASGKQPSAVIVIGFNGGPGLDQVARRLPAANVLALEPSLAAARAALTPAVCARVEQGRLQLLVGPDYAGAMDAWKLFERPSAMPPILVDVGLEQRSPDDVAWAKLVAVRIVLGAIQNEQARRAFAGRYLLNTLTNLPMIATESDVTALAGRFHDRPTVVVAAGPSLDRNIEELQTLDGCALIVAVDTAVRPLLAAGIRPHLVVSVDPSEGNARHLNDLPDASDMWLVTEGSVHPTVLAQFAGRIFTFRVSNHHPWPWLASCGGDRGVLKAWGSVLTTAFDLACQSGTGPIIFAGADLAYTDRLLYCRNTVYESEWSDYQTDAARAAFFELAYFPNHPTCQQPDVNGVEVASAPRFVQFRDWLVARADTAGDRRIVNATCGGILHGGRIGQASLGSVVQGLTRDETAASITHELASAWQQGTDAGFAIRVERGLDQLLQRDRRREDQLQLWADFGRDTVSVEQIGERAALALRGLNDVRHGRTAAWADQVKEYMQTLELTRQLREAQAERDAARGSLAAALAERDAAVHHRDALQRESNEAATAAFLGHYSAWRTHRLSVLMGLWRREHFRQAKVLELACGHGDIGAFFLSLGADVTFVDARAEHLDVVRSRYPGAATVLHDANQPLLPPNGTGYDFVIHMGLLYHLRPDAVAGSIANACSLGRHIVLETEVCDSDDPALIIETREAGFDQAVDGVGSRPSSACIERVLNECGVRWARHDDARLNTEFHLYDWKPLNNGRYFEPNAARADASAMQHVLRRFYTIEGRGQEGVRHD